MPYTYEVTMDDERESLLEEVRGFKPWRLADVAGNLTVSTIAMFRLDWAGRGYETMVLDESGKDVAEHTNCYFTREEAEAGHAATVEAVRAAGEGA